MKTIAHWVWNTFELKKFQIIKDNEVFSFKSEFCEPAGI